MAVKQVLEFCNNKIQSLEESINPYHIDKAVAKIKKAKNKIIARGMIEGLDPKMAGNIIKEMNALSSNENATAKEKIFAAQQIRNVFAYMQDFEVNDDLSMNLSPVVITPDTQYAMSPAGSAAFGFSLGFRF